MGHHGSEAPFDGSGANLGDLFRKITPEDMENYSKQMQQFRDQFGPTGQYPDGKLTDSDEGEIRIGITNKDGRIVIEFGKPIYWIGFTKEQAIEIGNTLIQRANEGGA